MSKTNFS